MNRLRLLRYERGLEVTDVAKATGLTRQTLWRLETGEVATPTAPTAKALADFYEVSVAEVMGVDESRAA